MTVSGKQGNAFKLTPLEVLTAAVEAVAVLMAMADNQAANRADEDCQETGDDACNCQCVPEVKTWISGYTTYQSWVALLTLPHLPTQYFKYPAKPIGAQGSWVLQVTDVAFTVHAQATCTGWCDDVTPLWK